MMRVYYFRGQNHRGKIKSDQIEKKRTENILKKREYFWDKSCFYKISSVWFLKMSKLFIFITWNIYKYDVSSVFWDVCECFYLTQCYWKKAKALPVKDVFHSASGYRTLSTNNRTSCFTSWHVFLFPRDE